MGSVLIVEDDTDLSSILAAIVAGQGHEVRTATNGQDALALVSEKMPDLILLDVTMPVMGGREFAARFRERYDRAARIVVMTAAASAAMRARDIGADDWLSKPFDHASLFRVLEQHGRSIAAEA